MNTNTPERIGPQPIKTAPTDGTHVLLWHHDEWVEGYFDQNPDIGWTTGFSGHGWLLVFADWWMPLAALQPQATPDDEALDFRFNVTEAGMAVAPDGQQAVWLDDEIALYINLEHPRWADIQAYLDKYHRQPQPQDKALREALAPISNELVGLYVLQGNETWDEMAALIDAKALEAIKLKNIVMRALAQSAAPANGEG